MDVVPLFAKDYLSLALVFSANGARFFVVIFALVFGNNRFRRVISLEPNHLDAFPTVFVFPYQIRFKNSATLVVVVGNQIA